MHWGWSFTKYSAVKLPSHRSVTLSPCGRSWMVSARKGLEEWREHGSRTTCGGCSIGVGKLDRRVGPAPQLSWSAWSGSRRIQNCPLWGWARIRRLTRMVGILRKGFLEYFHGSIFVVPSHCCVESCASISRSRCSRSHVQCISPWLFVYV